MRRPDPDPRFTLIASSFGLGMALLDVTAGNVALPSIRASLHTDAAGLSWVVDGYTLPFASFLLLAGGLGDRLGARRLFIAAQNAAKRLSRLFAFQIGLPLAERRQPVHAGAMNEGALRRRDVFGLPGPGLLRGVLQGAPVGEGEFPGERGELVHGV